MKQIAFFVFLSFWFHCIDAFVTGDRLIRNLSSLGVSVEATDLIDHEVEPVPIRIGHGFDIHRMAPVDEAGQPVVIGGVTVTHKDQKVCIFGCFFLFYQRILISICSVHDPNVNSGLMRKVNTWKREEFMKHS
mmetsp:Transcript_6918/g.10506  ORF Transcript_6918/g.10506 Transcript_6918/m.10506 type:complete len:133 (-) Transcript_6918:1972-2370(-)